MGTGCSDLGYKIPLVTAMGTASSRCSRFESNPFPGEEKDLCWGTLVSLPVELSGFPGMTRLRNWEVMGVMAKMG